MTAAAHRVTRPGLDIEPYIDTVRAWFFHRYASGLVDRGFDPEDCLADVWVKLLGDLHKYDSERSKPEQYLAMRLRSLVSKWVRDQGRKLRVGSDKMRTGVSDIDGTLVDVGSVAVDYDAPVRMLDQVLESVDVDSSPAAVLEGHLEWVADHYGQAMADRCRAVAVDGKTDSRAISVLKARLKGEDDAMTPKERAELDALKCELGELRKRLEVSEAVEESLEEQIAELEAATNTGVGKRPDGRLEIRVTRRHQGRRLNRVRILPKGTSVADAVQLRKRLAVELERELVQEVTP